MVVKPFQTLFSRLKLALRDACCSTCNQPMETASSALLCPHCEKRYLLRPCNPVVRVGETPLYSACEFPSILKHTLYGLKFYDQQHQAALLSHILIHYWQKLPQAKQWVVLPIPPHRNKAAHVPLFARAFASHFGYDFVEAGLYWQREVVSQHTLLNKRQRKQNILNAFAVEPSLASRFNQAPKGILVVDDLLTTGTTLAEATHTLKKEYPHLPVAALAVSHVPLAYSRQHFTPQKEASHD